MKAIKVLIIVALVIIVLPLLGYAGWLIKKGQPLEIFIVNKSMIEYQGSENKALNYMLNGEKVLASGNRIYDMKLDHFGLHWNQGDYHINYPRLKEVNRTAEKYDLVYYADACGIRKSQIEDLSENETDKIEYGGINNTDYNLIKEVWAYGKPLVLECGFFGTPTEPLVRYNLEQMIDIYYGGWMGKYVIDLSADADMLPGFDWKELFSEFTGSSWSAAGPGIVMINMEARRIFVLKEGEHIQTSEGLIFTDDKASSEYGMSSVVNYQGWFTILHPGRNRVLSEFRLNPTTSGMEVLNEFGVPSSFPALIKAPGNLYYLTGDFGKSRTNILFSKVLLIGGIFDKIKHRSNKAKNFFYSYYQPFMSTIVEKAIDMKQGDQ